MRGHTHVCVPVGVLALRRLKVSSVVRGTPGDWSKSLTASPATKSHNEGLNKQGLITLSACVMHV